MKTSEVLKALWAEVADDVREIVGDKFRSAIVAAEASEAANAAKAPQRRVFEPAWTFCFSDQLMSMDGHPVHNAAGLSLFKNRDTATAWRNRYPNKATIIPVRVIVERLSNDEGGFDER